MQLENRESGQDILRCLVNNRLSGCYENKTTESVNGQSLLALTIVAVIVWPGASLAHSR